VDSKKTARPFCPTDPTVSDQPLICVGVILVVYGSLWLFGSVQMVQSFESTLWLFNIAMENGSFIEDL
jgi:hypothetical protein